MLPWESEYVQCQKQFLRIYRDLQRVTKSSSTIVLQKVNGNVFEDALFDVFKAIMILNWRLGIAKRGWSRTKCVRNGDELSWANWEKPIHDDSWWFMMIHDDSWWFMMIHDDSWWLMMIHDDSWWFMMIRDDSWWFMMIHDDSWWFMIMVPWLWQAKIDWLTALTSSYQHNGHNTTSSLRIFSALPMSLFSFNGGCSIGLSPENVSINRWQLPTGDSGPA